MMECNRAEAMKAKELAEMKFAAKDIIGAKKFAIKAQNLCPELDGIGQMVATLNVHVSAEAVVNGERDWYAILSVKNSAGDEAVRKQYRKLALMLHPDKNKSIGAETAFMLISEAWGVLSDKTKRMMYDKKRSAQVSWQKLSPSHASYGFYHFAKNAASNLRSHKTTAPRNAAPSPGMNSTSTSTKPHTFWTSCNHCEMQYEHYRIYLHQNLLCPNCKEPFLASEISNPAGGSKASAHCTAHSSRLNSSSCGRNNFTFRAMGSTKFQNMFNLNSFDSSNFHWGAFSRTAGAASASAPSPVAAQAATMVHKIYEKVKREREERQAAAKRAKSLVKKSHTSRRTSNGTYIRCQQGISNYSTFGKNKSMLSDEDAPENKRQTVSKVLCKDCGRDGNERRNGNVVSSFHSDSPDARIHLVVSRNCFTCRDIFQQGRCLNMEFSDMDIQKMLMKKARTLVVKKLHKCSHVGPSKVE